MPLTDTEAAALKADLSAVVDKYVAAPPPPPPPPPPVTTGIVLTGSGLAHRQYNVGPADRTTQVKIDAAITATPAWSWFANAAQEFSPSLQGVPTTQWVRLPIWGNFGGLYKGMPRQLPDGTVATLNSKAPGDDIALNIVPYVKGQGLRPGKRGAAITTPYTAWRFHSRRLPDGTLSMNPDVPHLVGVDVLGNIWYRMRDGEVRRPFTIPGAKEVHDWCPRPASRKTMYVADTGNGRVLEILRGTTDFTIVRKYEGLTRPTSVISLPDDTLWVVTLNKVWRLEATGFLSGAPINIPSAFYLDYDSRGHLIVGCLDLSVWDVDPATGQATRLYAGGGAQTWVTVSVDREGTCGERDNIMLCHMHSSGNATVTVRKAGIWMDAYKAGFPMGIGQTTIGRAQYAVDLFGHYPWTAVYSPDSAEIYLEGASDLQGSLVVAWNSTMAPEDVYDHAAFTAGRWIIEYGVGPGTPIGTAPSFTCQMADQGWSGIGVTADMICEKSFADQAAFIQGGMIGNYPRPFIKGRDLYNVLYFLARSSQRGFREGKPYFDALKAWCQANFPWGTELPAIPQQYPDSTTDTFMRASIVNGVVRVTYTDAFQNPKTAEPGFIALVSVDEVITVQEGDTVGTLSPGQHSLRPVTTRTATRVYNGWSSVVLV